MKYKNILFVLMLCASVAYIPVATAQKLPNKQVASVYAPANIKINGKADELGGKFQAHNYQTDLFYTLSNNNKMLFLTIQATDNKVISRILNGGFTLSIHKSGDKKDKEAVSLTYPVLEMGNKLSILFKNQPKIIAGSKESVAAADSFMMANNKLLEKKATSIKITGVKGLDTLISIYNEEGVKAVGAFDNKMVYTCEIAIPIKYLANALNNTDKFTYHMMINATTEHGITRSDSADPMERMRGMALTGSAVQVEQLATDVWGDNTLAKKPL